MSVLGELQPNKVFKYFEEICSIPHGSRNLQQISDYLVDFAKAHELKYRQDEDLNVIIWKDGSKGYEASEPVILQGHMDMVAVKEADCDKDMEKEGLDLEINGDYISAKGTSLGGDDGIAVAYTLAVLDDEEMAHPPIEAIFTVNEEIGMLGAATIDVSDLKGRLFMNMDSEDEGVFTVSCAGGASVICKIPYETETVNASVIEIKMTGFAGGHSGVEIIKGRLNANCAMARVLLSLFNEVEMQLVSVNGGEKDNAIAKFSEASVAVLPEELEAAKQIVEDTFAQIKEQGWTLKAGKGQSAKIEFWYPYDREQKKAISWQEFREAGGQINDRYQIFSRAYSVYNGDMIVGIPKLEVTQNEIQPVELVDTISGSMGVSISYHKSDQAFYRPVEDRIYLPYRQQFHSEYAYASTALHELSHATGSEHRLNRKQGGEFGT